MSCLVLFYGIDSRRHTRLRPPLAICLMTVCAMSCLVPFYGVDSRRHTHWTVSTSCHLLGDGLCDVLSGAFLWHRQQKTHTQDSIHLWPPSAGRVAVSGPFQWRRQQKTRTGQRPPLDICRMTGYAMSCLVPFYGMDKLKIPPEQRPPLATIRRTSCRVWGLSIFVLY